MVSTNQTILDQIGTIGARLGVNRVNYSVAPGLYGIGSPDRNSPVLVTANYKLSFDTLRGALKEMDVWLLVLDTRGINVWCAAGKGTFSTEELVFRIKESRLERLVDHRRLVVPQLGATGVSAHRVKEKSGFSVQFGPIRAADLQGWFDNGSKISSGMREVTFTLRERAELIPVELYQVVKSMWWLFPLLFIVSGIGPIEDIGGRMVSRGSLMILALLTGTVAGAILVPLLLPWLPGRSFALKGGAIGLLAGVGLAFWAATGLTGLELGALVCTVTVMSSYLGMNFTGSTPYTSPSGVEWEMKRAIPVQFCLSMGALLLWLGVGLAML